MLTSITPLGERGRGQRWALTASFLAAGHLLGGLALGSTLAVVGGLIRAGGLNPTGATITVLIALAALGAVAADLAGMRLPGRRQVDDSWLTSFRGWVYGFGFGLQLGLGFLTVVNTSLFGAVLVAGILVPVPAAVGIGVLYGGTRAAMAVGSGRVRSTAQLKALHRRLDEVDRTAVVAGSVAVAGSAVGSVAVVLLSL